MSEMLQKYMLDQYFVGKLGGKKFVETLRKKYEEISLLPGACTRRNPTNLVFYMSMVTHVLAQLFLS